MRFKMLALSVFQWENLPNGLRAEQIEEFLYDDGKCIAFLDDVNGFLILRCHENNLVNVYGEFTKFNVWGYGYNKTLTLDECVLIRNNIKNTPTKMFVDYYTKKLIDIDETCDVNLLNHTRPYIIKGTKNTVFSIKNMFRKILNKEPLVVFDKKMGLEEMEILNTNVPYILDKLTDYYTTNECRLLTLLGIDNHNVEKKERLLTDEINSNNQFTKCFVEQQLEFRKKACELINAKYGYNITVKNRYEEVKEVGTILDKTV